jgi:tagaturonate epimerase
MKPLSAQNQNREMLRIAPCSIGIGDRFAHQAKAQLRACQMAAERGADVIPVWNKSNREHLIVGSEPASVRAAADEAVRALGWNKAYHVDADHIRLDTVGRFIPGSDFFTIDVADSIGQPSARGDVEAFAERHPELIGQVEVAQLNEPFRTTRSQIESIAGKYLRAVREAGEIYRHIAGLKGESQFITEVSMDETDSPQTPPELLVILAAIADEGVPVQTIAPKFTGRFNKGVDYAGDLAQFEKEFEADIAVIAHAIRQYELPETLKLSVHSGSDKFSLYPVVRRALRRFKAGVHLKTAGTTWLEEIIGLAEAGDQGLELAKEIYAQAAAHIDELCAPYAAVIDIDPKKLPAAEEVEGWKAEEFVSALRHDPGCAEFNPHLRQLLHVGYKIAAGMGDRYIGLLEQCEESISRNVTENLFARHIKPLFLD